MGEAIFKVSANIVALIPFAVFTATGVFSKDDLKEIVLLESLQRRILRK